MTTKRKPAFQIYSETRSQNIHREADSERPEKTRRVLLSQAAPTAVSRHHVQSKNGHDSATQKLNGIKKNKAKLFHNNDKKKFSRLEPTAFVDSIREFNSQKLNIDQLNNVQKKLKMKNNGKAKILAVPNSKPSSIKVSTKSAKSLGLKSNSIPLKNLSKLPETIKMANDKKKIIKSQKKKKLKKDKLNSVDYEEEQDDQFDEEDEQDNENGVNEVVFDSRQHAIKLFKKLISPLEYKDFFSTYWEKKPLLIKRHQSDYYSNWFSCQEFDDILRNHNLEFTTNVDVTTYINGVKEKHNQEGRAFAPLVWDYFQQGCSIRLLNPQTYSRYVWNYLSYLQELFGTFVGANVYLTPAGTQGFAPHYDDIEAFVIQLEGKKRWRVYEPISKNDVLPRFSSPNFTQEEIGEPIIDCILETGDLLYFPRGFIHQANATEDIHSLHMTISCYQKNTWGDFLAKLLPAAIETAMHEDVEFRRGLPLNYMNNNGIVFDSKESKEKSEFIAKTTKLIQRLASRYLPIDGAVDQMAKQFVSDAMPPCLNSHEYEHSIHGHGEKWNPIKNRVQSIAEIEPDTSVKLIRRNCLRLVVEGESCLVYNNLGNSRVFQEKEPQYLEVESSAAPAIEFLIRSYPKYVTVEELPLNTLDEKIAVTSSLYDNGLLVTGEPLECLDDDESHECYEEDEIDSDETKPDEMGDEDDDDNDDFNSVDYDQDANEELESETEQNGDTNDEEEEEEEEDDDDDDEDEYDDDDNDQDEDTVETLENMEDEVDDNEDELEIK